MSDYSDKNARKQTVGDLRRAIVVQGNRCGKTDTMRSLLEMTKGMKDSQVIHLEVKATRHDLPTRQS